MKRKIIITIIISQLMTLGMYAQFDPKPQIQLPSAEAQSLGKFGEIPVDLFTGRVNIDIPVYTIKYYDIEVPISISYHGGGIKVTEESGSVGLGWTLNVGGVVNRIVRGMPDNLLDMAFKVAGYEQLNSLTLPNGLNQFHSFIDLIKQRDPQRDPTSLMNPITPEEIYLTDMISKYGAEYDNGHFDTAPDNYSFQVQGLSGVFIHKKNSTIGVTLQSNDGVSISREFVGYTITDANGYVYKFQDEEQQTYFYKTSWGWYDLGWENLPDCCYKYTSSWWLSSITSPTGEKVNFYYTDAKIVNSKISFYGYTEFETRNPDMSFSRHSTGFNNSSRADTTYKKVLDRIETLNSIVRFSYRSNGDLPLYYHALILDKIGIYARSDSEKIVEEVKFSYDTRSSKIQLLKLTKQEAYSDETQSYMFLYKPTLAGSVDSRTRDHWDYYSSTSTGTFPQNNYFGIVPVGNGKIQFGSRDASSANADNAMLYKIIYPTGGSSEFIWEPHIFSKVSRLGEQAASDGEHENGNSESYGSEGTYSFVIESTLSLCGKSANEILSVSQSIGSNKTIKIDLSSYYPPIEWLGSKAYCLYGWNEGNNFNEITIGDRPHIRVKKNGQLIRLIHICAETLAHPVSIEAGANNDTYTFELKYPREAFNFSCGGAEMDVYYNDYFNRHEIDKSNYGYVNIQIGDMVYSVSGSVTESYYNSNIVGGVRIKRIINKKGDGANFIKEYSYVEDPFSQSPSSGVLAYYPRYASQIPHCETTTVGIPPNDATRAILTDCPKLLTLRSNGLPYTLNGGSHIEYSKVAESVVETSSDLVSNNQRKPLRTTIYSYWTGSDDGCSDIDETRYGHIIATDMLQLTSQNYMRGHLKEKIEYTDERKVSTFHYEILEQTAIETITGSLFTVGDYTQYKLLYSDGQGGSVSPYKDMGIVKYRVIPYNKRLLQVNTEGSKSNDYEAYTYANNTYSDNRGANLPLSHSTVDSDGDTVTQYFTYKNVNSNKIRTCIIAKKGKIIDAYRNEYDTQGRVIEKYIANLNPLYLPSVNGYNATALTNVLVESYIYNNNRLVQLNDHRSGISTVYLWSYNGTYPVAEIQNTTFSNICNLLGNNTVQSLYTTCQPNMNLLNGLRTTLASSLVSTMTYELLIGITSFTDPKGATTYFNYNGFGQLKECYIIENGQKKIVQKMEYNWNN